MPVEKEQLRDYVAARLKGFYEEELEVQLVLFDQMLDHVLRIDRIYRQPQGHLLLIGTSGSGKTTLSRFVAWINGLSVYQVDCLLYFFLYFWVKVIIFLYLLFRWSIQSIF